VPKGDIQTQCSPVVHKVKLFLIFAIVKGVDVDRLVGRFKLLFAKYTLHV
jgi:hypothetical protein